MPASSSHFGGFLLLFAETGSFEVGFGFEFPILNRERRWSAALWRRDAGDERVEQGLPCREDKISGDRPDVLEKADPRSECLAGLLPHGLEEIAGSVEHEGQEVHHKEHAGQCFLAMAERMLEVVPFFLRTLSPSFSHFHLARPQAMMSSTLWRVTARSVTTAVLKVIVPVSMLRISRLAQVTGMAAAPSRIRNSSCQA